MIMIIISDTFEKYYLTRVLADSAVPSLVLSSGVARAFPGGREDQNEEEK